MIGKPVPGRLNVHDEFIERNIACSRDYLDTTIQDLGMVGFVIGKRDKLSDEEREEIINLVEQISKWSEIPTLDIYSYLNTNYNFGDSSLELWRGPTPPTK